MPKDTVGHFRIVIVSVLKIDAVIVVVCDRIVEDVGIVGRPIELDAVISFSIVSVMFDHAVSYGRRRIVIAPKVNKISVAGSGISWKIIWS